MRATFTPPGCVHCGLAHRVSWTAHECDHNHGKHEKLTPGCPICLRLSGKLTFREMEESK